MPAKKVQDQRWYFSEALVDMPKPVRRPLLPQRIWIGHRSFSVTVLLVDIGRHLAIEVSEDQGTQ